ncbi:MAG: mammalian cell entry protein [Aeromicrobium sp.]|nr:mammalian cell entry protein [Aeromicrobium sp.]
MKRLWLRMTVGLIGALLVSGCGFSGIYDLPLPGNKVSKGDGFEVSADFSDALNVAPRSSVMVGDVPIGQVESVTRVGWHARIKMLIRDNVVLPDNAVAEIQQTSLLGEKFIALSPPTGGAAKSTGRLGPGDVIPMASTGRNPEVEEVLGALSFVLTGGGIGQIQTITKELNAMMDGRTDKIRDVLPQLNTLVSTLNSQKGDIIQAMDSINGLSKTLVTEKGTIGDALDAAGPAIDVLRDEHTKLVTMLSQLDKLGVVGTRVVNETKDDLIAELRHLEPVLRKLSDTGDELVPGLVAAASYPFPIDAADAIHGDFANVIFKMQIKLTPISEGGLLPTTLPQLVTLCRGLPTAPICSPAGDAINQICSLLASLPLCANNNVADISAALDRASKGLGATTPTTPTTPTPSTGSGGGATGSNGLLQLIGGLLGGGSP